MLENGQNHGKMYSEIGRTAEGFTAIPKEGSDIRQDRCGLKKVGRV